MSSLYLRRQSADSRQELVATLHESQGGNCFICNKVIDLQLHNPEIDHIEPLNSGGKDGPINFALTHSECNRTKLASHLRVARVLASFADLSEKVNASSSRSATLHDVLIENGGSRYQLSVTLTESSIKMAMPDMDRTDVIERPIYVDELSGFKSAFVNLPIEYIHHDNKINPRAIGSNLRKLVEEFHKGLPQLHVSLGWIDESEVSGNRLEVRIFDGQHKAAAQILLGARELPVRLFVNPNLDKLLTANTHAGTTLRQVAFDKSVQRSLGSSILDNRIERYRKALALDDTDERFSEQDLVNHFKGESREIRRYCLDAVRHRITNHPDNKLRDYIEYGGKAMDKPLSYSTVEKTFYQFFIGSKVLTTPLNYLQQEGMNPRYLEVEQSVRLMNIVAERIYTERFDYRRGTRRIERDIQNGVHVKEDHLTACRMSKEEIVHNWVRQVRKVIYNYFVTNGKTVDEPLVFQQQVPEPCWTNVENFIDALANLPLWINRGADLSTVAFGTKRTYDYWYSVFLNGTTPDGFSILPSGLDLTEMIQGKN